MTLFGKWRRRVALFALAALLLDGSLAAWSRPTLSSRARFTTALAGTPALLQFLALQRPRASYMEITGRFFDWRTVSKYRSHAGLHLGYDVAMPAGTAVVAGWSGQVTRILNWYGPEYGITVLSPNGYEVTYGHLRPGVEVGRLVQPGDVVGYILPGPGHVDMKMRAPDGQYYDFGGDTPSVAYGPGMLPTLPPPMTKAQALRQYLTALYTKQLTLEESELALASGRKVEQMLADEKAAVEQARANLPQLEKFYKEGLVARVELEAARKRVAESKTRLADLRRRLALGQGDADQARTRLAQTENQLSTTHALLVGMGMSDADIQQSIKKLMAHGTPEGAQLKRMEQAGHARRAQAIARHRKDVAQARQDYERMQHLFQQGAVSRDERDRARQKLERLGVKVPPAPHPDEAAPEAPAPEENVQSGKN